MKTILKNSLLIFITLRYLKKPKYRYINVNVKYLFTLVLFIVLGCNQDDISILSNYPTEGLVAYFPFDGNWDDIISPNTIVTTPENDPVFDVDRNGNENSSIYFQGSAQYLNITLASNIISSPNHQATIALWLRNDVTPNWLRTILAENSLQAIGIETDSESPSLVSINYNYEVEENENDIVGIGSNLVYPSGVGEWVHLAYTVDSEQLQLFINGQHISSRILGGNNQLIPIQQPYIQFVLGANHTSDIFWRGNVDELFFYDRALSNEEIEKLYSL